MSTIETRLTSSFFTAAAILVAALGVLFFYHLDEDEVVSEAEARVLLTAQEMNRAETWTIPTMGAHDRWEKPPFYVWSVKFASLLDDGKVGPISSRLPGAVAMSLLVLLAAWWAYQHFNAYPRADGIGINAEGFALLSGLLLATNPQMMNLARSGENDSIFAFFCFAAIYCLGQSFEVRRSFFAGRSWRQWVLAAYFLIGLGMLTKGPAAFLFVLIPYMAMCWSYKLRRPDPIHLAGLLLALAVGGTWYVLAATADPEARKVFLDELLTKRFGSNAESHRPFYFYVSLIFKSYSPWILLAGAMVWRNLWVGDRTPTLVTWSCALLSGLVWLSIVGSKRDEYFLPVAPFVMLLAGDALMRWDFDSQAGKAFRVLIRFLRYGLIIVGFPLSVLLGSESGILLSAVALLVCILFAIHRRRTNYVYAVWERTVHGAALLVFVLGIYETVYALDVVSRSELRSEISSFLNQVDHHLPDDARLYIYDHDESALFSYYLDRLPTIIYNVDDLEGSKAESTYLITDSDVDDLMEDPRLIPLVTRTRSGGGRYRSAFFKYIPTAENPEAMSPEEKLARVQPLRLAVLGNAGHTEYDQQRELAKLLDDQTEDDPLHAILTIGDVLTEGSRHDRIDFYASFERPYRKQLRDGIPFYGLLGEQDLEIAPVLLRYPLLQMNQRRYYRQPFFGGLIDYFALDANLLLEDDEAASLHWKWIEQELASSQAVWKIVGCYLPLVSHVPDTTVQTSLFEKLLPILDSGGAQIVLTSDEAAYQRIRLPGRSPLFFSTGWSGEIDDKEFRSGPELLASYSEAPGLLLLTLGAEEVQFRAVNIHGASVDAGRIRIDGTVEAEPSAAAAQASSEPTAAESDNEPAP